MSVMWFELEFISTVTGSLLIEIGFGNKAAAKKLIICV